MAAATTMTLLDMLSALERGETSSVHLVRAALDAASESNELLHAFVTLTPERALEAAQASDARRADHRARALDGIPTAVKDLTHTAGVRTTMGSALLADFVPDADAEIVQRAQGAGLISLGKTNTPEFGLSSYTDNDVVGPTGTPWDPSRNAGGSSGGAAAAVAAGVVPVALGSDGGGSIRIPASCCGVFGFKPTQGRIDPGRDTSTWSRLVSDGVLSRSVDDAACVLDVLAGSAFTSGFDASPGSLRIARWTKPYLPFASASEESLAAVESATQLLSSLGHEIVDIANPWPAELEPQFNVIWSSGMAAAPIPTQAESALRPTTRYWREFGARHSAVELARALSFVDITTRTVLDRLKSFDAFLTPTLAMVPQPHGWFTESGDPAEDHRRELLFTPYTALMNMSGQPAASLPLYVSAARGNTPSLPIGVMLAAHRGEDARLLALCRQLEQTAGFTNLQV